ncbi:hypothetical protein BDP55DRAFT_625437 [Colletotrichum godetiae]|uniref:Uncharacterized protein n=1 Tax=Colletotrichum godetiae TaxID=1209918 RepID=A0AAJ0F586_9PEZI|nr:uncharacterized protein BDP55DRAFT_625437 [Colletotrichum godetiae]KAK1701193.1 hypothetical protein BDP55DRAFT_625437 [Colletotrichum godetiae]
MTQLPGVPQESGRYGVRYIKSASHRYSAREDVAYHTPLWPTSYMCLVATSYGLTRPELSNLAANPLVLIGISSTTRHTCSRRILSPSPQLRYGSNTWQAGYVESNSSGSAKLGQHRARPVNVVECLTVYQSDSVNKTFICLHERYEFPEQLKIE